MRLVQSVKEKIMKNGLPEGYTRLEYLQSTGVQYIDTGYIASNTSGFSVTIMPLQASDKYFIGSRPRTVTNDRWLAGSNAGPQVYIGWNTNTYASWELNKVHTVQNNFMNSRTKVLDSTTVAQISETLLSQGSRTTYLFSANDATAVSMDTCRIYKAQITDGSVLVRDFIPALDPSNKPCMYDLVSKQPFYNQGTGADFSIGKKLTPVEYLQSSGTQYIKTDYTLTSNTKIDVLFSPNQQTTANLWVIGSYVASNKLTGVRITGETTIDCYINTVVSKTVSGSNIGNRYQAVLDGKWIVNGSEGTAVTVSAGLSPLTLFGWNASTTANAYSISGLCSTKIYHCKIWDNNTLVRDFIPVRDENNAGYMLDLLTNTLYTNAGTGSFTIGEDDLLIRNIGKTKFFKQTTRKVPKGFQEVEYLESSGTQYIDTGYAFNSNTDTIELGYQNTSTLANKWLFGSYENNANIGISSANLSQVTFWYKGNVWDAVSSQYDKKHILKYDYSGMSNDGVNLKAFTSYTGTWNLYLFALNNTGTSPNGYFGYGKIWAYKHKRNGVLIRDFVPYLDANGRPCMWDRVEGKPYYNIGTEEFTYGRKIIPVEYLESTGTQYIDTGVLPVNDMEFECKFTFTSLVSTNLTIVGSRDGEKRCQPIGAYNNKWSASIGGSYDANGTAVSANTPYIIKSTITNGQTITTNVNGSQVSTCTSTTGLPSQELYVFARNFYGNTDPADSKVNGRLYFLKIKANGVLVRDFIPVKDENGIGFMFDKVTHSAFLNQGTGQFSYGDIIKERTETLRVLPIIRHLPLNYLEATGTQYINTGLLSTANSKVDSTFSFTTMEGGATNNCAIFGGRNNSTTNTFTFFKIASQTPQYFRFDYNSQPQVATANQMAWNTTSKYRLEYTGVQIIATNLTTGESVTTTREPGSTFTTSPICLFAVNTSGTISTFMKGRIYHYWYTDGTNTIDLYPVLKLPERIPCMYDRVSKTYFYNESTDPFLYG